MTERWKEIKDYEGKYEVSDFGRIRSLSRSLPTNYNQVIPERILKPVFHTLGYCSVLLQVDGLVKRANIHRLVALAFIPNPENKPQVNHKDGNKANNQVSNLEWVTHRENMKHAYDTGLVKLP